MTHEWSTKVCCFPSNWWPAYVFAHAKVSKSIFDFKILEFHTNFIIIEKVFRNDSQGIEPADQYNQSKFRISDSFPVAGNGADIVWPDELEKRNRLHV